MKNFSLSMFYWSLALRCGFKAFSFRKESLRFPVPRRVAAVFILFPLFLSCTLINRIFMLLDWVFFPRFVRTNINEPVFIIGVARSATTYLYKTLAHDQQNFTCFKMWEILFAPSIIQKYFWRAVIAVDRKIGRPLKWCADKFDRVFLAKITRVHETGLSKPEEDEMLLLYTFTSMYLTFFFPDLDEMDAVIFFDEKFPEHKNRKVMDYYKRCVQRHMFVFGANGSRKFLSKNPGFISKMDSVAKTFPDAKLVYMLRSPFKTIPSTISMNRNVYGFFSSLKFAHKRDGIIREVVIRWYEGAEQALQGSWRNRHIVAPFRNVTQHPKRTLEEIYSYLDLKPGEGMVKKMGLEESQVKSYSTEHRYNDRAGIEKDIISERLAFILNGEYKDLI